MSQGRRPAAQCVFVSDLHGSVSRYERLFELVEERRPAAVLMGGDLLPSAGASVGRPGDFVDDVLAEGFRRLRSHLGNAYPLVLLIPGNDDPRAAEPALGAHGELWRNLHGSSAQFGRHTVFGYSCVPPTPFRLKDWERYDVSRFVDPGAVSPEEGWRTVPVDPREVRFGTIRDDLASLVGAGPLDDAILLLHAPPYQTRLDRAALDGRCVDHVPLDVHVGSIAVRRLIEERQPLLTLHGHVHESARLTGNWRDRIGRTHLFSAAHDGPELAVVHFDPDDLDEAQRELC